MDGLIHGLEIDIREAGDSRFVSVAGELDIASADALTPSLVFGQCCRDRMTHLDLGRTRYIDSTGIQQLVKLHRHATEEGGDLIIYIQEGSVIQRVFNIIHMDEVLPVVPIPNGKAHEVPQQWLGR
jgi:anti-anti-sigma factor